MLYAVVSKIYPEDGAEYRLLETLLESITSKAVKSSHELGGNGNGNSSFNGLQTLKDANSSFNSKSKSKSGMHGMSVGVALTEQDKLLLAREMSYKKINARVLGAKQNKKLADVVASIAREDEIRGLGAKLDGMDIEGMSPQEDEYDDEDTDIEIFRNENDLDGDADDDVDDETKRLMKKYNVDNADVMNTSMELPMLPSVSSSAQANAEHLARNKHKSGKDINTNGNTSNSLLTGKTRQRLVQVDTDVY